jgi:hypothetical protein
MKLILLFAALLLLVGCAPIPEVRCLVSPLHGTITAGAAPVVGATVTRSYYSPWYDQHVETVTHTDIKGDFKFKGAWKVSLVYLVHQPVIREDVVVKYRGTNYTVLHLTKMDYCLYGELSVVKYGDGIICKGQFSKEGHKLFLSCNLDKKPTGTVTKQIVAP